MRRTIEVFVQTCPGRERALAATEASLRTSDVGDRYTVLRHPEGMRLRDFFVQVLQTMAAADADHVIRLEDDVLVNRHLLENVSRWLALGEKKFGAGWLFVPDGVLNDAQRLGHSRTGWPFRQSRLLHCCQGVVLSRNLLPAIIPLVEGFFLTAPGNAQQDLALSSAIWDLGRRVFLHSPPLVEHRIHTPSTFGHQAVRSRTTGDRFMIDWRGGSLGQISRPLPARTPAAVRSPVRQLHPPVARSKQTSYTLCVSSGLVGALTMPVGTSPMRRPPPAPSARSMRTRFIRVVSGGLEGAMTMVSG